MEPFVRKPAVGIAWANRPPGRIFRFIVAACEQQFAGGRGGSVRSAQHEPDEECRHSALHACKPQFRSLSQGVLADGREPCRPRGANKIPPLRARIQAQSSRRPCLPRWVSPPWNPRSLPRLVAKCSVCCARPPKLRRRTLMSAAPKRPTAAARVQGAPQRLFVPCLAEALPGDLGEIRSCSKVVPELLNACPGSRVHRLPFQRPIRCKLVVLVCRRPGRTSVVVRRRAAVVVVVLGTTGDAIFAKVLGTTEYGWHRPIGVLSRPQAPPSAGEALVAHGADFCVAWWRRRSVVASSRSWARTLDTFLADCRSDLQSERRVAQFVRAHGCITCPEVCVERERANSKTKASLAKVQGRGGPRMA